MPHSDVSLRQHAVQVSVRRLPRLAAFRDLCVQASNGKHPRTEPLETQVLRLWKPLEPHLSAYQRRLNTVKKDNPRHLSLLESDLARVDSVLAAMSPYVQHYQPKSR